MHRMAYSDATRTTLLRRWKAAHNFQIRILIIIGLIENVSGESHFSVNATVRLDYSSLISAVFTTFSSSGYMYPVVTRPSHKLTLSRYTASIFMTCGWARDALAEVANVVLCENANSNPQHTVYTSPSLLKLTLCRKKLNQFRTTWNNTQADCIVKVNQIHNVVDAHRSLDLGTPNEAHNTTVQLKTDYLIRISYRSDRPPFILAESRENLIIKINGVLVFMWHAKLFFIKMHP